MVTWGCMGRRRPGKEHDICCAVRCMNGVQILPSLSRRKMLASPGTNVLHRFIAFYDAKAIAGRVAGTETVDNALPILCQAHSASKRHGVCESQGGQHLLFEAMASSRRGPLRTQASAVTHDALEFWETDARRWRNADGADRDRPAQPDVRSKCGASPGRRRVPPPLS